MRRAFSSGVGVTVSSVSSGASGRLVRVVDAGETFDLAAARLGVHALDVARLADLQRRVDEHFDEVVGADHARARRRASRGTG